MTRYVIALAAVLIAGVVAVYGLRQLSERSAALASNKAQLDTNATQLDTAIAFREKRAGETRIALEARVPIAAKRTVAKRTLVAAVDAGLFVPPEAIALIGLDEALIQADAVAMGAVKLELLATQIERDRWKQRAQLLQARVEILERRRCGVKCVGAALLVIVVGVVVIL